MVTVNDAQKYRDSVIGSAEPSRPAQWVALHLPIAEIELLNRTSTATAPNNTLGCRLQPRSSAQFGNSSKGRLKADIFG